MKKVSVITYHRVYNYGATLQAYATVKCFEKLGYRAEIIDYVPEKVRDYGSFHQALYETKLFHKNPIKCVLIAILKMPSYKRRVKAFSNFINTQLPITRTYYSEQELKDNIPVADIYCTGSDQVWNNTYLPVFDFVYFLSFVENKNKIAFSASFGRKDFTELEMKQILPYLQKYKAISVREKSGLSLLSEVDISMKENVVDPTLILNAKEWTKLSASTVPYSNYILVYQLHGNSDVENAALKIAKVLGKRTVKIVTDIYKITKCDFSAKFPTISEFLALFEHADLVVTDSFHGTAFSINFNINFIVKNPGTTGERIQSILEMTGLLDRIVTTEKDAVELSKQKINFKECNRRIEEERNKAFNFLKNAITLCKDE